MSKILALSLVLLPALPAFAARTLALATVIQNGSTKLLAGEPSVTVRAPKSSKLSRSLESGETYVPAIGT
jgi:hypothetical protein